MAMMDNTTTTTTLLLLLLLLLSGTKEKNLPQVVASAAFIIKIRSSKQGQPTPSLRRPSSTSCSRRLFPSSSSTFHRSPSSTALRQQQQQQSPPLTLSSSEEDGGGGGVIINKEVPSFSSSQPVAISKKEKKHQQTSSRVVTGVAPRTGPLNEAVAAILNDADADDEGADANDDVASTSSACCWTLEQANELIEMGAVWARLDALTDEDLLEQYNYDDDYNNNDARVLYADYLPKKRHRTTDTASDDDHDHDDLDSYIDQMEQQRYRRILTPSSIDAGTDLKIYPHPRRFPVCYDMTRDKHLLYEDPTFLVVDKPPMLPTQPDASNYHECCPGCVQSQVGPFYSEDEGNVALEHRPLLCHRVDACVGGCVVLSKTRNGQKVFAEYQRDRKIRKMYLALTTNQVPLGQHVHWMWKDQTIRGATGGPPCQLVSHQLPESRRKARQFWNRCVLEVTKCVPIRIKTDDEASSSLSSIYYQSTIRLVTGRKHQVRAQLASLGCPILRDTLYEPIAGLTLDDLEENSDEESEVMEDRIAQCRVPTEPIGLQAAGILFGGIKVRANTPWWGKNNRVTVLPSNN